MSRIKPKCIYLLVQDKNEQLELTHGIGNESIKELFRTAGEACASDILKLYNHHGNLVNISTNLPANTPSTRYRLEVVKNHLCNSDGYNSYNKTSLKTCLSCPYCCNNGKISFGHHLNDVGNVQIGNNFNNHKDVSQSSSLPSSFLSSSIFISTKYKSDVLAEYDIIKDNPVDPRLCGFLNTINFNNWSHSEAELMHLMQHMFLDFNINKVYKIESSTLHDWLKRIFLAYNEAPFHNFKHCFCVTQMIYAMLKSLDLVAELPLLDIFILLFSGVCHDLDHSGFNNTFQINAQTELALRYNDASPLENHHCATAFYILQEEECNITKNMQPDDYLTFRKGVIQCILATDLAKHDAILADFNATLPVFDFKNNNHRLLLSMILIKVADISNEARPVECADKWMECLFQEYFHQSDVEKAKGLKVTPYMDRETVSKCKSQIGFINILLLPLIESLCPLRPSAREIIRAVQRNLNNYKQKDK